jgi:DNA-binding PadR family transcriptional regulator
VSPYAGQIFDHEARTLRRTGPLPYSNSDALPLSPASFFVLFALADGEKHGYRIMRETATLSNGTLRIGAATLYTTLAKLVAAQLIEEVASAEPSRRRTYRLTTSGGTLLQAEFRRLSDVLDAARIRNVFPPPPQV